MKFTTRLACLSLMALNFSTILGNAAMTSNDLLASAINGEANTVSPTSCNESQKTETGNEIYAWNKYSNVENNRYGLYRLNGRDGITKVWEDQFFYDIVGIGLSNGYLKDGKIIGQAVDKFGNTIFEMQRVVFDFETGDVEGYENITDKTYFDRMTYDPIHDVVYATIKKKGKNEPAKWVVCEEADWDNYQELTTLSKGLSSLCYNVVEGACYAINLNKDFVRIEVDGQETLISHLDFDFDPGYFSGLVYSPTENLYYASPQREVESFLMTITPEGEWEVYHQLPGNNQLNFMVTPNYGELDTEAPLRPVIEDISFDAAEYYGTISYLLPTELVDGNNINGRLELYVYVDGEEYSINTGYYPGDTVEVEFDDLDTGLHFISAYVSYNNHNSQKAVCSRYVGFDTPLSPTNVILTETNVSWSPVGDRGIHDSDIDVDGLKYNVYINGVYYGSTQNTSLNIQLPDEELKVYIAEVYAEAAGLQSEAATSNSIVYGSPFTLPMHILPTPEQALMCAYIDDNEDGYTWKYDEYFESFVCEYSYPEVNDDWLVMPPFKTEQDNTRCKLKFFVANYHTDYPDERLEVYLGTLGEDNKFYKTQEIVAPFTPEMFIVNGYQTVEAEFDIPAAGTQYIGFHWISEPDQAGMEIKDIIVTEIPTVGVESIRALSGIFADNEGIEIRGHAGAEMSIASMDGKIIFSSTIASDSETYPLIKGIYFVTLNGLTTKVLVK